MFLSRIEVNGFKSFCNRKEIIINKGITGVVGPNGSGKSNIADALRWVLGEQSSKNLRGQTMQDVIFNGTMTKSKKNYCEVSLIFDNTNKKIESEFSEISVKRKMYRSGESVYYINSTVCRLKDVIELFRDTGIGKEGYSIIGQGKIDEILTSKPSARRKVFEEAAGIMKYRIRKEEAEKNLEKTKENIGRLLDIINELNIQLEPLEKQMFEAKNYIFLRNKLKELEINLFLYNFEKSDERISKNKEFILENDENIVLIDEKTKEINTAISKFKHELNEIQSIIETHNAEFNRYSKEQERLKGNINLAEEKERNFTLNSLRNKEITQSALKTIELNEVEISKHKVKINELNTILDQEFSLVSQLKDEILVLNQKYGDFNVNIENVKSEVENKRSEIQSLSIELNEKQVKEELLKSKFDEIKKQITEYEEYIKNAKAEIKELEEKREEIADNSNEVRKNVNLTVGEISKLKETQKELEELSNKQLYKYNEYKSRHNLLTNMEYEGYFDSVRELFKSSKHNEVIQKKIVGVLAELIEVPKEFETPIEIILGNALQNVVVKEDEDAKTIIEHLRKNNLGRITFLPTNALKIRYLQDDERKHLSDDGVLCVASEAIKCDASVQKAVDFLLGRTVIVRDMQCAIKLMRKTNYAFRTVTMDGDFIKPGGVITGGSLKNKNAGFLSRKRIVSELEDNMALLQKKLEESKKDKAKTEVEIANIHRKQQEFFDKLKELEIASTSFKEKIIAANNILNERDELLYDMQTQELDAHNSLLQLKKHIDVLNKDIYDQTIIYDKLVEQSSKIQSEFTAGASKLNELKDKLNILEKNAQELKGEKNMVSKDLDHLKSENARLNFEITQTQNNEAQLSKELNILATNKKEIQNKLDEILEYIKNAGGSAKEIFTKRDGLTIKIDELDMELNKLNEEKNKLIENKYKLFANQEKIDVSKEALQNKIWDEYSLTYANALEYKIDFSLQSGTSEIEKIKEQIKAMGSINANAIEDYSRVKERYDNLILQKEDLENATADLEVVIGDLLSNMTESFKEKFALINTNFSRVYKELFGGGEASIVLLDEDNIMECGIEIIAEPPGKKLQSITLLSGGEKAFTAIALLFAMLEINPSPICLLDEIDAPLDDANVIRFSDYVKILSVNLQFIIITHRKPTMAICDTLYGIAMQEKGISNIVSVKLN